MTGRPARRERGAPADSGVDRQTGEWTPAFDGQRPPFQPGHQLSVKHGAHADLALTPRAGEIADAIRPLVPGYTASDEIALRLLGLVIARLEKTSEALATAKPDELERLRGDERGWVNSARRYLNDLGLTPTSRAQLALALARTGGALNEIQGLDEYLDRRYGEGEGSDRA